MTRSMWVMIGALGGVGAFILAPVGFAVMFDTMCAAVRWVTGNKEWRP